MAINGFVNFGDIKGESTDKDHKDWVTIAGYHQSLSRAELVQPGPGGAGGQKAGATHSGLSVVKRLDVATPKLYEACATGQHIKEVTIDLVAAKGGPAYLTITLKDVLIGSIFDDSDPVENVQLPTEAVSLTYGAIEFTYRRQNADGSPAGNVTGKWDLTQGAVA